MLKIIYFNYVFIKKKIISLNSYSIFNLKKSNRSTSNQGNMKIIFFFNLVKPTILDIVKQGQKHVD